MTVGWLLDAVAFDTYHDELADAITRNGYRCASVNRPSAPYQWDDSDNAYRKAFPKGSCVVTHGDIDLVTRVLEDRIWTPGAFASVDHFFCSHYFSYFGSLMLNRDYIMLPYAELPRCQDFLFATLGKDDRLFVRPDSPLKIFTGMTIERQSLERDYEFMGFYEFPIESLIVISSPKDVVREWRFVVADGQVVAGTQYVESGERVATINNDSNALEFAKSVPKLGWTPDPVWVLDVCKTADGQYSVMEIGGFSFASLYGCDKSAVVQAVSQTAQRIHSQSLLG